MLGAHASNKAPYSAYPAPSGLQQLERTLKTRAAHGNRPPAAPAPDLSTVYPEAVVASSEDLGWHNVRVVQMRHDFREMSAPPLENHCVMIHLGSPVHAGARIGGCYFNQRLQPGELIIIPAGASSEWRWPDGNVNETLQLYLRPNFVREVAQTCDLNHSQTAIEPQLGVKDEQLRHVGMSLLHELREANAMGRLYADSVATALALQLVRRYSWLRDAHVSKGGMAPHKLRKSIELMNDHLEQEEDVALGAIAGAVGMSYYHFSRSFKQAMGASPNNYLIERRIERAKKLLSETGLPIAEVALRVGFASQSHFTSTFRRLAGRTPKSFRGTL